MHSRTILVSAAALALTLSATAQTPSWVRRNSISPDGSTIAFSYKGDIYTVPSSGGQARQLTSNQAFDSNPIWTRDGKNIVFISYRESGKDIYITSENGGVPARITNLPGNETPLAVLPDGSILFSWYNGSVESESYGDFQELPSCTARIYTEQPRSS